MKLVEAEQTGPIEGEEAIITPPRPLHRRVSVSLLFTFCVLVGLVITIYTVFPPRHHALVGDAVANHRAATRAAGDDRDAAPVWDLANPTAGELRAWAIAVVGRDAPLPPPALAVIGARRGDVDDDAIVRVRAGADEVTFAVAQAHGVMPGDGEHDDGDLHAFAWRVRGYQCVVVGPAATAARWRPLVLTPAGS
nr:hypothetical protein [Kofleriaceae bacterium]